MLFVPYFLNKGSMKIIIDTREQEPLIFADPLVTETYTTKLEVADYAAEFKNGYCPPVVFERKSINDLFGTLGKGYERFKRELEAAKELGLQVIIIVEGTLFDVLMGIPHSQRDGSSVVKQLFSIWIRYNVYPVFCSNRVEMAQYIVHFYSAIGRRAQEDLRNERRAKKKKALDN